MPASNDLLRPHIYPELETRSEYFESESSANFPFPRHMLFRKRRLAHGYLPFGNKMFGNPTHRRDAMKREKWLSVGADTIRWQTEFYG